MILDQRHMSGSEVLESVEEVEAFWATRGRELGFRERLVNEGDPSRELRRSKARLLPYVDGGRWVADCPRCSAGVACWPENPRACCLGCGTLYAVEHPDPEEVAAASAALAARPAPFRSWRPGLESVDDLKAENLLHGHAPADAIADRISEIASSAGVPRSDAERVLIAAGADPAKLLAEEQL